MLQIKGMDDDDKNEFKTILNYLEKKHDDLSKKKKDRMIDSPKQLLQMANTIRRALSLSSKN